MHIETISYLNEVGELLSSCHHDIPDTVLIKALQVMLLTRYVDDHMLTLHRQGLISFSLSSLGEECCAVGCAAALEMEDWIYPQYRELGVMFWRGYSVQDYIHHMFGNAKDITQGRQMPNHFGSRKINVVTVSSPIGTKIPHAAGCAYAMKLQHEKSIAVSFFGEGATSEGDFHAGLNFAAVRKAPVIFFCRNNCYAISTPTCRQFASEGIAAKGIGYGITTFRIDGNDFFAVHETIEKARSLCLEGKGPILIEAMTYRLGAHSTSDDPSVYRRPEEVTIWKEKDPILRLQRYLEKKGKWDSELEHTYIEEVGQEVSEAIEVAKSTPPPPLQSIIEHVYLEPPESLKEQYDFIKSLEMS